ncbi:MAG: DUF4124 domain-containing protein [Gammaproteobacteria bacterium]|nr:DUF4124 domain-containing protein [Gammaproteobacteria bacterium]MDT8371393.1 DUF4124 domain-containing protein [Gammaproteobacteria bacterium]
MFKPYLSLFNLYLMLAIFSTNTVADVYKWVDENGQTHYSQQAPAQQKAELLKTPPPPAFNPEDQQRVDQLIKQQQQDRKARIKQQQQQQQAAEQLAIKQQNCTTAKNNLQQYQDNPGRRVADAEGNVTRLKEEDRQQRIQEFQQQVQQYCN